MKRTTRVRLAGVGLLAALVGVACGDSDDNTETAAPRTERLTKAEFISQGDELCAAMNSRLDPIFGELFTSDGPPSGEQMQTALGEISEIIETTVADLKKLPVPAGDNAALAAIFTEVDASLGKIREAAGTPDGALALMESDDDPFAGANELFSEYGFEDCAGEGEQESGAFGGEELTAEQRAAAVTIDATGTEYTYTGIPETVTAGPVVVKFTNTGAEEHELGIVRIRDGLTFEEVLAAIEADPEDESFIERMVGGAFAQPGEGAELTAVLEPGLYGYACFIDAPDGQPHIAHGMYGSFTVTE